MTQRRFRSPPGGRFLLDVSPETAGWRYLSFKVARLGVGEVIESDTGHEEVIFVPLAGRGSITFCGQTHGLSRRDLFREVPDIVYLPPHTPYRMEGREAFEVAWGGAPAQGLLPPRFRSRGPVPAM